MANLSYLELGNTSRQQVAIFIHGIMANKKNWLSFVNKWLNYFPAWTALIFDLPNHGDSPKHIFPYRVQTCAHELLMALKLLGVEPQAIIGHSFGAKVALLAAQQASSLEQLWLLDSCPGAVSARPLDKHELSALELIEILSNLAWPQSSRRSLVSALLEKGVPNKIALWMTTNLKDSLGGFELTFVPAEIKAMLLDFLSLDLWPLITKLAENKKIHLVAAEHGHRLNQADQKMLALRTADQGFFHVLNNAGHFLHADNPAGLINLMLNNW